MMPTMTMMTAILFAILCPFIDIILSLIYIDNNNNNNDNEILITAFATATATTNTPFTNEMDINECAPTCTISLKCFELSIIMLTAEQLQELKEASTKVQSICRMKRDKKKYRLLRDACIKAQSIGRMRMEKRRFGVLRNASIKLQSVGRKLRDKKKAELLREKKAAAEAQAACFLGVFLLIITSIFLGGLFCFFDDLSGLFDRIIGNTTSLYLPSLDDICFCLELLLCFYGLAGRLDYIFGSISDRAPADTGAHETTKLTAKKILLAGPKNRHSTMTMTGAFLVLLFSASNINIIDAWISIVSKDNKNDTPTAIATATFMTNTNINEFAPTCTIDLNCDELGSIMMTTAALNDKVDNVHEAFANLSLSDETKIADDQLERFADMNLSDETPTTTKPELPAELLAEIRSLPSLRVPRRMVTAENQIAAARDDDDEGPTLPETWKASGVSRGTVVSEEELTTESEAPTILQATWQKMTMAKTDDDGEAPKLPKSWKAIGSNRWMVVSEEELSSTKIQSVFRMFLAKKQVAAARRDAAAFNDIMNDLSGRLTNLRLSDETQIADCIGLPPPPSSSHKHGRDTLETDDEQAGKRRRTDAYERRYEQMANLSLTYGSGTNMFHGTAEHPAVGGHTITVETVTSEEFDDPTVVYDGPVIEMFPGR